MSHNEKPPRHEINRNAVLLGAVVVFAIATVCALVACAIAGAADAPDAYKALAGAFGAMFLCGAATLAFLN